MLMTFGFIPGTAYITIKLKAAYMINSRHYTWIQLHEKAFKVAPHNFGKNLNGTLVYNIFRKIYDLDESKQLIMINQIWILMPASDFKCIHNQQFKFI